MRSDRSGVTPDVNLRAGTGQVLAGAQQLGSHLAPTQTSPQIGQTCAGTTLTINVESSRSNVTVAAPGIASVYEQHAHIGPVLPAEGCSSAQLEALRQTINATQADVVAAATPIDLGALLKLNKPVVRARCEFVEVESPGLAGELDRFLARLPGAAKPLTRP